MADKLINPLKVEKGNLTNILTPIRDDVKTYEKSGNVVTVHLNNVVFGSTWSSDTDIFTVPYSPVKIVRFALFTPGTFLKGYINGNNIGLSSYNGDLLYGSVSYITEDT